MYNDFWKDRKVFITGHSGFKGSWLVLWLKELGASVTGYSLHPPSQPNHLQLLNLNIPSVTGDVRDITTLHSSIQLYEPEIVFHLAAQPLVRYSYNNPVETIETNVMGTVNLLEACRKTKSVRAIVNITSDKCYENKEWIWGYRENDPMGGFDPYSASKGCAEIITSSYRNSFFNLKDYGKTHNILLASVRAGNVIGGGDWAEDRLIPDIVRAVSKNEKIIIRNPGAIRPWQYVLEPLKGYLSLGRKLLDGNTDFAGAWNFGPGEEANITVVELVKSTKMIWPQIEYEIQKKEDQFHESRALRLDSSKAICELKWKTRWNIEKAIFQTINWYKSFYEKGQINSLDDILEFTAMGVAEHNDWSMK